MSIMGDEPELSVSPLGAMGMGKKCSKKTNKIE